MKPNFKTTAIMVMASVIGVISMSSCAKNGDGNDNSLTNGDKPVSVSLVLTENVARSVAAPVTNNVAVTFKSGYVVFTNSLGIVNKVTEIVSGSYSGDQSVDKEAAKTTGTKVWLDDLKTVDVGGEIKNVPGTATTVYIIGNLPTNVDAPALTENISAIKDRVISISTQSNDDGSVDDVTLYGDGTALITPHPTVAGAKYAQVNVNAIASRIEIGKISYSNSTGFVKGFKVDGIFINHYYPTMSLASKVSVALINNNTSVDNTAADLMYMSGSSAYTDDALFDYSEDGLGFDAGLSISWSAADPDEDTDKNVWAYNVLAPTTYGTPVTALAAPHIVIRLSGFTTKSDDDLYMTYPGTQYLTVKEFRKADGNKEVIKSFLPGYVYRITNLTFNESNLTDVPETETVIAYVEAVLMTWTCQDVDWEF